MRIIHETHTVLTVHLELDSFQTIVSEVDEAVGPTAFAGRTTMHVLASLVTDTFPNYSYNGFTKRFVRSPALLKPIDRPKNPKADHQHFAFGAHPARAFEMANKLHRSFIGTTHVKALVDILGTLGVPLLINNLLTNLRERLEMSKAYLDAITEGLPPCKLPKAMYGLAGCYGVFDALLKPILAYVDLKPEVFQAFKEIGNALCFIQITSGVLDQVELERKLHVSEFIDDMSFLKFANGEIFSGVTHFFHMQTSAPELIGMSHTLHQGTLNRTRSSLFSGAIRHLCEIIAPFRSSWTEPSPNHRVIELEASGSFHRLWSALSFLFGVQGSRYADSSTDTTAHLTAPISDDSQFGHGFFCSWCGTYTPHGPKNTVSCS